MYLAISCRRALPGPSGSKIRTYEHEPKGTNQSMKKSIGVSPNIETFFGTRDENVRLLEDGLSITINLRSENAIELEGAAKDVARVEQVYGDVSKGKELDITGETELVNRLNEIRKQYNLATLEDLEKAAQEQGVSYEDFKANIRNGIITQEVMRQEVGRKISIHSGRGAALL